VKECTKLCLKQSQKCSNTACRYWIDHRDELNCALISILLNEQMTLKQIGERLNISTVRVKQILDKTLKKIKLSSEFDVLGN
jgi:DNA-directed RNA polymerase sigma subunit (sigma70/sigma32)